jgi:hypothetical protein
MACYEPGGREFERLSGKTLLTRFSAGRSPEGHGWPESIPPGAPEFLNKINQLQTPIGGKNENYKII